MVIGNHYPEFEYERSLENLEDAIVRLDAVDLSQAHDSSGSISASCLRWQSR